MMAMESISGQSFNSFADLTSHKDNNIPSELQNDYSKLERNIREILGEEGFKQLIPGDLSGLEKILSTKVRTNLGKRMAGINDVIGAKTEKRTGGKPGNPPAGLLNEKPEIPGKMKTSLGERFLNLKDGPTRQLESQIDLLVSTITKNMTGSAAENRKFLMKILEDGDLSKLKNLDTWHLIPSLDVKSAVELLMQVINRNATEELKDLFENLKKAEITEPEDIEAEANRFALEAAKASAIEPAAKPYFSYDNNQQDLVPMIIKDVIAFTRDFKNNLGPMLETGKAKTEEIAALIIKNGIDRDTPAQLSEMIKKAIAETMEELTVNRSQNQPAVPNPAAIIENLVNNAAQEINKIIGKFKFW
jgi:hypothetical protein